MAHNTTQNSSDNLLSYPPYSLTAQMLPVEGQQRDLYTGWAEKVITQLRLWIWWFETYTFVLLMTNGIIVWNSWFCGSYEQHMVYNTQNVVFLTFSPHPIYCWRKPTKMKHWSSWQITDAVRTNKVDQFGQQMLSITLLLLANVKSWQ